MFWEQETLFLQGGLHQDLIEKQAARKSDIPCWYTHYLNIWDIIKRAEVTSNEEVVMRLQKKLKAAHKKFTRDVESWIKNQSPLDISGQERALKREAESLRKQFEYGLFRYALTYLHLNRHILRSRHRLEKIIKKIPKEKKSRQVEISGNVGFLLHRAYKDKAAFVAERKKREAQKTILIELEKEFIILASHVKARSLTRFRGFIRKGKWDEAQALASQWPLKCRQVAQNILKTYDRQHNILQHKDQYLLETQDIVLLSSFSHVVEARIDSFIEKYSLPYIEHKFIHLLKQAYRLGQVGNFETLFTLYEKLILGIAKPLQDERRIKLYEGETLRPATHKAGALFPNLPDILTEADNTAYELEKLLQALESFIE